MAEREGPLTIEICDGCKWLRLTADEIDTVCTHPKALSLAIGDPMDQYAETPKWCPAKALPRVCDYACLNCEHRGLITPAGTIEMRDYCGKAERVIDDATSSPSWCPARKGEE